MKFNIPDCIIQINKSNNYLKKLVFKGKKIECEPQKVDDGYIINLWHLYPNFKVNPEKVIFLQPGFLSTGLCYFGLKENSMAYFLE